MNETTYESSVKAISSSEEVVFALLSDMSRLEKMKDKLPQDKLKDLEFDADSVHFSIDGLGRVGFRIISREPNKTIKFGAENLPIAVNFWIQLKQMAENDTRLKLTLRADLPTMIKMMVDSKLKQGIDQMAEMLAQIPYNNLAQQNL